MRWIVDLITVLQVNNIEAWLKHRIPLRPCNKANLILEDLGLYNLTSIDMHQRDCSNMIGLIEPKPKCMIWGTEYVVSIVLATCGGLSRLNLTISIIVRYYYPSTPTVATCNLTTSKNGICNELQVVSVYTTIRLRTVYD